MLNIWTLNVGHGDAIILEFIDENGEKSFGVIDSNKVSDKNKTLIKLKELGAKELAFVALTHPHLDHYLGMSEILAEYQVNKFYSCPLKDYVVNPTRLTKFKAAYSKIYYQTEDESVRKSIEELMTILVLIKEKVGVDNWFDLTGSEHEIIFPPKRSGGSFIEAEIVTPPKGSKAAIYQLLDEEKIDTATSETENNLSLSLKIEYKGNIIYLGGDATKKNLMSYKQRKFQNLEANISKLPHHGSGRDCNEDVINYIYGSNQKVNIALISANGRSHPSKEVLSTLGQKNIKPYCTSLATSCNGNDNIVEMFWKKSLDPNLQRFVRTSGIEHKISQPCQGDIMLSISNSGEVSVTSQIDSYCPYRETLEEYMIRRQNL